MAGVITCAELRTIEGEKCSTFKVAYLPIRLLDDDKEKNCVMEEASTILFDPQLREVFCIILLYCMPADSLQFRNMWKYKLAEDIMRNKHKITMSVQIMQEVILRL